MSEVKASYVATPEPMPQQGEVMVGESLKVRFSEYIDARTEYGVGKYGTPLQTDNGRNPFNDSFQEILDFCQYQEQDRLEAHQKVKFLDEMVKGLWAEVRRLTAENQQLKEGG